MSIKSELVDVARRSSAVADSRIASLDVEIQKQVDEKTRIRTRLENNISKERGNRLVHCDFLFISLSSTTCFTLWSLILSDSYVCR